MPEAILGPIGYADDVLVVIWVIDSILNGQNDEEKDLIHSLWQGSPDDLARLRKLLKHFDVIKSLLAVLGSKKASRKNSLGGVKK